MPADALFATVFVVVGGLAVVSGWRGRELRGELVGLGVVMVVVALLVVAVGAAGGA